MNDAYEIHQTFGKANDFGARRFVGTQTATGARLQLQYKVISRALEYNVCLHSKRYYSTFSPHYQENRIIVNE